jgi:aminopeptidase
MAAVTRDPRLEEYARILVETCVGVQPGWQVVVSSTPLARPLVEEVSRQLARRGAYSVLRIGPGGGFGMDIPWVLEAPEELLDKPAPLIVDALHTAEGLIGISAPENTREQSIVPAERFGRFQAGMRPHRERLITHDLRWVGCQYPTPALAQDAGMSLDAFTDFLFGACLLDWDAERERMSRYAERFDASDEVRIVGDGTDLTLSLAGRTGMIDAGGANMPGGEFFFSPVEDSAGGTIAFTEFPAVYAGREVTEIRLRFEGGRVVDARAATEEEFLLEQLDRDEGARRLGELGIGCNPGITRHLKNTLFDEKMDATVHLALGNGFPELGGENVSEVHWDIVKDLRRGGRILVDGEVVQENGAWLV